MLAEYGDGFEIVVDSHGLHVEIQCALGRVSTYSRISGVGQWLGIAC